MSFLRVKKKVTRRTSKIKEIMYSFGKIYNNLQKIKLKRKYTNENWKDCDRKKISVEKISAFKKACNFSVIACCWLPLALKIVVCYVIEESAKLRKKKLA